MATSDGTTLTGKQPPAIPGVASSRLARTPIHGTLDPKLGETIESLKRAVESIINGTEWPSESRDAAKLLVTTVKSSPYIPNATTSISQELQNLIERYIQTLEDIRVRLNDASSKSGMQRWKILQRIKSLASNRPSKCTLLLQTCQDDLLKAVKSFNDYFDSERRMAGTLEPSGIPLEAQTQPTVTTAERAPVPPFNDQTKPVEQGTRSNNSISGVSSTPNPPLCAPEDEESRSPIRAEALTMARKTFKGVDIASGSIPVVGSFVAVAAKVGLTFVEAIQTMDKNSDLAKDLGSQTAKLSELLANFRKKPNADQRQGIADNINHLQEELRHVYDQVKEWRSLGRFEKAFHSRDHAEALKGYQEAIQTAMEEMQLLVGINTNDIVTELTNNQAQAEKRHLLDRLGDGKYGAQGNAVEDVTCFPGTRVKILERIDNWIRDSSTSDRVLWIRGMAGRGKSTIASTVVQSWKCRASCAIFHYHRGQNTLNTRIVCALARQLATSLVPEVRDAVLESVQENQDIADERLEEQFKALFVTSLTKLDNQLPPILVVVDALDECDNPKDAVDFVRLIDRHAASFPTNVKFLLTSRPEAPLLRTLEPRQWLSEDLDTAPDVSDDLELFIQQSCKQIRDSDSDIPEDWPSSEDVRKLVEMSQGLFQWARTAITYVSDGSPVDRLRDLLGRPSVWSGLDDLYHQILSKAFNAVRLDVEREDLLHRVLGTLAVAPYPVSLDVIAGLYGDSKIFGGTDRPGVIMFLRKDILADLNSLLFIPTSSTEPVYLMHTSIHDLLVSERRCKQASYYINLIQHHQHLASMCLGTMLRDLRENICSLSDLSKPASEVQNIAEHNVPRALLYCCRSWSIHLTEGVQWPIQGMNAITVKLADFEAFSKQKLMCWLEVMSLAGATKDAIMMATQVYQWLLHHSSGVFESNSLATLWNDTQRFIAAFSEPIQFGPLHIYVSALPQCPVKTELGKLYRELAKVRTVLGVQVSTWPSNIWVRSLDESVQAVAFSPDGKALASASDDNKIRLWDTQTGTLIGEPLMGHTDWVRSVCFSPDGRVLASGSDDGIIRLWGTQTRTVIGEPLTGHCSSVSSVRFSPNGRVLASGSSDNTIRLWDTQAGMVIGEPLTGHSRPVNSVCFSPNGKILASGSYDRTVRLWDTQAGTVIGEPLTGHSDCVNSLSFSPDGKVLASGSSDNTIRLWDAQAGTTIDEPLTGHGGHVNSVCFSPDGKVLASGTNDKTIRLWDTRTRAVVGEPLTGHDSDVNSVCFSPDGKVLASGSHDKTVRLWDTQAGTVIGEPLRGHSSWVRSVSFSPDGKVLASGSYDNTIQLWDTRAGTVIGEPLTGHSDCVNSLSFSPDGKVLASGSSDNTIRLWDTQTGTTIGAPLTGHNWPVTSVRFSSDGLRVRACDLYGYRLTWNVVTPQRCETPHTLPSHRKATFQDHWIVFSSSRFLWLPHQYWGHPPPDISLSGNTLAVLRKGNLSLFDVSQALEL